MEWLRVHWYVAVLTVFAVLVVGGGFIVESRAPASSSTSTITWGAGVPLSADQISYQQSPQQVVQQVIGATNPSTLALGTLATTTEGPQIFSPSSNSFDYVALLQELSGEGMASGTVQINATSSNTAVSQAYQFIPTGFIATTAPATKPMSAQQKLVYDYGNEVGGEIESFEQLHTNQAQILQDQAQDRTDPTKSAALVSLGQSLASVGTFLQQVQDVPPQVKPLHDALAQSYIDIGTKLQLIAKAQQDKDFVQAIENYDTSANTFVHNYAALAQFFQEYGVTFSSQDPGSVFSFTETGGI